VDLDLECNTGNPPGCLFELTTDEIEHVDIRENNSTTRTLFSRMAVRIREIVVTGHQSDWAQTYAGMVAAEAQATQNGGFWGPWND